MKYLIVYGSCGHGHQRAAEYLAQELRERGETDITLIDFLDYTTPFFKKSYPFFYKYAVTHLSLLWKWGFHLTNIKSLHWLIGPIRRFSNKCHAHAFEKYVVTEQPAHIILTHFLPSEICSHLRKIKRIGGTVYTIITDSIAHATWINRSSDFFIGFSEDTKKGLLSWGIPEHKIRVLGIPLARTFQIQNKKAEYRTKYGLSPDQLTILITSGSFGMGPTEKLIDTLSPFAGNIQLLVVCGNNKTLFDTLSHKQFSFPVKLFPFINFMDELMEAADIIIAKSGGMTMCESLSKEVPMIISQPIPGQETYNAEFLTRNGAAWWIRSITEVPPLIGSMIENPSIRTRMIAHIRTIKKPEATKHIVDFITNGPL